MSDEELSAWRRGHLGRTLARARWAFEHAFEQKIREAGFDDYRRADIEIIARLPLTGARITELADRAHISKQAVGKQVRGLEARGLVERRPDPDDGRAQRVTLTRRGKEMLTTSRTLIEEMERQWRGSVDPADYDACRRVLSRFADTFGPAEYL